MIKLYTIYTILGMIAIFSLISGCIFEKKDLEIINNKKAELCQRYQDKVITEQLSLKPISSNEKIVINLTVGRIKNTETTVIKTDRIFYANTRIEWEDGTISMMNTEKISTILKSDEVYIYSYSDCQGDVQLGICQLLPLSLVYEKDIEKCKN